MDPGAWLSDAQASLGLRSRLHEGNDRNIPFSKFPLCPTSQATSLLIQGQPGLRKYYDHVHILFGVLSLKSVKAL